MLNSLYAIFFEKKKNKKSNFYKYNKIKILQQKNKTYDLQFPIIVIYGGVLRDLRCRKTLWVNLSEKIK